MYNSNMALFGSAACINRATEVDLYHLVVDGPCLLGGILNMLPDRCDQINPCAVCKGA
jgi:hypothetical protein